MKKKIIIVVCVSIIFCYIYSKWDWYFQGLVFGNIYSDNSVNDMTFFGNTGSTPAHFIMQTACV